MNITPSDIANALRIRIHLTLQADTSSAPYNVVVSPPLADRCMVSVFYNEPDNMPDMHITINIDDIPITSTSNNLAEAGEAIAVAFIRHLRTLNYTPPVNAKLKKLLGTTP